jgi:hypothetical protein
LLAFCGIVAAQLTAEVEVAVPIGRRTGESWIGLVDGRASLLSETKDATEKHESASLARGSENLLRNTGRNRRIARKPFTGPKALALRWRLPISFAECLPRGSLWRLAEELLPTTLSENVFSISRVSMLQDANQSIQSPV